MDDGVMDPQDLELEAEEEMDADEEVAEEAAEDESAE